MKRIVRPADKEKTMKQNDSYTFRRTWIIALSVLPDKSRLLIREAIDKYALLGIDTKEIGPLEDTIFTLIKEDIGKEMHIRQVRSSAGKKHRGNQYSNSTNGTKWNKNGTKVHNDVKLEQNGTNEIHNTQKTSDIKETDWNKVEQSGTKMEQNGTNPPIPPYNNIIIDDDDNPRTREQMEQNPEEARMIEWLKMDYRILEDTLSRNKLITKAEPMNAMVEAITPFVKEFCNGQLTMVDARNYIEHGDRNSALRHFRAWLPKYIKSSNGTNRPNSISNEAVGNSPSQTQDYNGEF